MGKIQDIFIQFGESFKKNRMLGSVQKKAIRFISKCRTSSMGELFKKCNDCGHQEVSYCSCRNRHCPQCQTYAKEKWIHARKCDLLKVRYFHIVFTLPSEISAIARYNRSKMFAMLFRSVSETLKTLGNDSKWLGAQIGAMLIFHSWTQRLLFHPHIHALVPNGGLLSNGKWKYGKKKFFIPVRVMGSLFRGKYMHYFFKALEKNELILPEQYSLLYQDETYKKNFKKSMYNKKWYVYAKKTFNGPESVIEYLGRYTHRVCISDYRIEKVTEKDVTYNYHDNKDNGKLKSETLLGEEFMRRFLWHTLPSGFVKIRYIGLLSNRNKKDKLTTCQRLTKSMYMIEKFKEITEEMILAKVSNGKAGICSECGGDNIQIFVSQLNILNMLQIE